MALLQQHAAVEYSNKTLSKGFSASDLDSSSLEDCVAAVKCKFGLAFASADASSEISESVDVVEVHSGPVKAIQRMRAKLSE